MLVAIGDIHGEAWKLRDLLVRLHGLPLADEDRLVFVGDYVDRGPDVSLTLELLLRLKDERPNTIFLRGNHDQAMLDVRDVIDPDCDTELGYEHVSWWFAYGGRETISSYGGGADWYKRVPEEHWRFLRETELEFREGGYIFVHAGLLPPGRRWFERDDPRMWVRNEFLESTADFGGVVVYGHTPTVDGLPRIEPTRIGIDTGVARGGPLTAALLVPNQPESARFISVA